MLVRIQLVLSFIAVSLLAAPSPGTAFTSFHVFGDGISCTATNAGAGAYYYGKRYSNGRVWVEVLAQQQGLAFDPAKNTDSFFGNTSGKLVNETAAYTPPADAGNALVVIWVNNADLYYPALDPSPTIDKFNNAINLAMANELKAINNLYAKGIRTLVMPNVVDICSIPQFDNCLVYKSLFHQASLNYNAAFYAMLEQARSQCPGLNIIVPDFYSLLQDLLANPSNYGVLNALCDQGNGPLSIDAMEDPALADKSLNGPGANYVFWDPTDPTAKVHYIMACFAQQLLTPVQVGKLTTFNGSNRLDLVNLPLGAAGFVEESTNLTQGSWTLTTNFSVTGPTQSLFVIAPPLPLGTNVYSGGGGTVNLDPNDTNNVSTNPPVPLNSAAKFYRLRFPFNWTWP
jgi:phospholipase/lecithinase/hemolysin